MKKIIALIMLIITLPAWAQPTILTSIKPLQLITQAVTGNQATIGVLLPPGATPHHYSMRPSDIKKITNADLVIWLGSFAEPYLEGLAENKLHKHKMLDITPDDIKEIHMNDLHFWLGPQQAVKIAMQINEKLKLIDPTRKDLYQANLHKFQQQLEHFSAKLKSRFTNSTLNYLVYHNAYQYFELAAGIDHVGIININPEIKPSAKQLVRLQNLVQQGQVSCIIAEPQADTRIINLIIGANQVKVVHSEPMATTTTLGSNAYLNFIEHISKNFESCVASGN